MESKADCLIESPSGSIFSASTRIGAMRPLGGLSPEAGAASSLAPQRAIRGFQHE